MTIEFHCNHCDKLIRTADENAGKRGSCPRCHQSVYVPTPSDQIEIIPLAPLDEGEEREKERLLEETRALTQRIREDKTEVPPEAHAAPLPVPEGDVRLQPDMETLVIEYAVAMAAGNLAEAADYAHEIRGNMAAAEDAIQRLTMDELPHVKLRSIPRPVLIAFFKQLHEPK